MFIPIFQFSTNQTRWFSSRSNAFHRFRSRILLKNTIFLLFYPLNKPEMSKKAIQTRWEWSNEVKPALKWLVLQPQWWKTGFEPNLIPFRAFIWQKTRFYPLIWDKRRYPGLFPPDADFGNTFFMIPNVCGNNPEKRKFGTLSKIKWHFPLSCQNLWTRPLGAFSRVRVLGIDRISQFTHRYICDQWRVTMKRI